MRRWVWLTLLVGCVNDAGFLCGNDEACGPNGTCEPSTNLCSFPDMGCASHKRYGEHAGSLSLRCVNEEGDDQVLPPPPPPPDVDAPEASDVDAAQVPDAAPPDAVVCPADYTNYLGISCYRIVEESRSWLDAEQTGEGEGAHLLVIDDFAENQFFIPLSMEQEGWIGLSDRRLNMTYRWVTGHAPDFSPPWDGSEPEGRDCVVFDNGVWKTEGCGNSHYFACEVDGRLVDPLAY